MTTFRKLHLLPVFLSLWFILSFLLMYGLAVWWKDVEPVFPYISDTGTYPPGSCIFGQLMNIGSILLSIVIYIRYLHIRQVSFQYEKTVVGVRNAVALFLGWSATVGIGVVANFQETVLMSVHLLGAMVAFGVGAAYQLVMWRILSALGGEIGTSKTMNNFRLAMGTISFVCFFFCFLFAALATMEYQGTDIAKWKFEDGGYKYHLASTFIEWICATSTMMFVLTYYEDFRYIEMDEPIIRILPRK